MFALDKRGANPHPGMPCGISWANNKYSAFIGIVAIQTA
jgi:hypothetical protein